MRILGSAVRRQQSIEGVLNVHSTPKINPTSQITHACDVLAIPVKKPQ